MRLLLAVLISSATAFAQEPVQQTRPRLLNPGEMQDLLDRSYSDELRLSSIKGIASLRVFITKDGVTDTAYVAITSGSQRLDYAATNVARKMRFSPARMGNDPVGVWLTIPVSFLPEGETLNEGELPALVNGAQVREFLNMGFAKIRSKETDRRYVEFVVDVDASGAPSKPLIFGPSCSSDYDGLARKTMAMARFEARGGRTNGYMRFSPDSVELHLAGDTMPQPRFASTAPTPMQERINVAKPQLRNRNEVSRALIRNYPPYLRDTRQGGTVLIWILVGEKGTVQQTEVRESSGSCDLDNAARRVAHTMLFFPALIGDKPTEIWIQLPIVFRVF